MQISLRALEGFEAAARLGSVAKAAAELGLSRTAISHRISELEAALGVPLIDRTDHDWTLSPAGAALQQHLASAFAQIRVGLDAARKSNPASDIVLSASPFFAARFLSGALDGALPARFGGKLHVIVENRFVDLQADEANCAVRFGGGHWPGLSAHHLLDVAFGPVCKPAPDSLAQRMATERQTRLVFAGDGDSWSHYDAAFGTAYAASRAVTFDSFVGALQACLAGQGVMMAPVDLLGNYLGTGQLIRVHPYTLASRHAFYFVAHPAHAARPDFVHLREWLERSVAA
jgi:LysR family transcriptional regulator, glycine cleavage system transcriptional activator